MEDPQSRKLAREEEVKLLIESCAATARLELEKLQTHIGDILKFGDEYLVEHFHRIPEMVMEAETWLNAHKEYVKEGEKR